MSTLQLLAEMNEEDFYMAIVGLSKALRKLDGQMLLEIKHL